MKTTLDIDDPLLERAKRHASAAATTLRARGRGGAPGAARSPAEGEAELALYAADGPGLPAFCIGELVQVVTRARIVGPPSELGQARAFLRGVLGRATGTR